MGQRIASPPHARGTIEHILVLRGAAAIGPDEAPVVLRAGDFAAFAADAPHSYEAVEPDVDAAVLMAYPAH